MPAAVGVPLKTPVEAFRLRPAGRAVKLPKEVGEFVALMEAVRLLPTVPLKVLEATTGGKRSDTVMLTVTGVTFQLAESAGVKVALAVKFPAEGKTCEGLSKVSVPFVFAVQVKLELTGVSFVKIPVALGVTVGVPLAIEKVRLPEPVPSAFVALTATVKLPAAAGIPEKFPVLALRDTPGGSVPFEL